MNQLRRKAEYGVLLGVGIALLVPILATIAARAIDGAGFKLTVNLTPSVPVGLYLGELGHAEYRRGDLVGFLPHNGAASHAYRKGWIKPDAWYIKRVRALPGDMVCVGDFLLIQVWESGSFGPLENLGPVASEDPNGDPLPRVLKGCRQVPHGHFLPVGDGQLNSFDGRYYGFVPQHAIKARMRPLWTTTENTRHP